jgi:hypothetical protein
LDSSPPDIFSDDDEFGSDTHDVFSDDDEPGSATQDRARNLSDLEGVLRNLGKKSKEELDSEFEEAYAEMLPDIKKKWWEETGLLAKQPSTTQTARTNLYVDALMAGGTSSFDGRRRLQEARRGSITNKNLAALEDSWCLAASEIPGAGNTDLPPRFGRRASVC